VKVRIRHPILTKQVEQIREKWLVIDDVQWRNCNMLYILLWSNIYLIDWLYGAEHYSRGHQLILISLCIKFS
jgi:hypothetical protein